MMRRGMKSSALNANVCNGVRYFAVSDYLSAREE